MRFGLVDYTHLFDWLGRARTQTYVRFYETRDEYVIGLQKLRTFPNNNEILMILNFSGSIFHESVEKYL